jgi:hypothetical protein
MQEVFDCPMQENDSGATTIKGYLKALLTQLWAEGEGFSGKRPFGNSGWEYDLYKALLAAGLVEGRVDPLYNDIISIDTKHANKLIFDAIKAL